MPLCWFLANAAPSHRNWLLFSVSDVDSLGAVRFRECPSSADTIDQKQTVEMVANARDTAEFSFRSIHRWGRVARGGLSRFHGPFNFNGTHYYSR